MDKVVEYISAALEASGIDRYAVYSAYIHGLSPNVVEALYHIFPNMAPRIGANAPITTQLPAVETPTVTADTAHLPTPPVTTAEAKGKHQQETTPKRAPVAGPGEVVLRVGGLAEYGTHLGVVRLPLSVMERLGLKPGDFVEIIGATSTYAVVQPTEEEDVVKMDEVTRSNAGAELGDYVRIKKAVLPPAEKIVLGTNQPVDAEYVKRYLLFKPLAKGNITAVPQQDKTVTLRVEDVVPAPAAYVQLSTKIEIQHDNTAHSKQQQPEVGASPAPEALLQVFNAKKLDYGRSTVRIPVRIMKRLGVEPGDYVEIVGRKTVYAQVWPVYPEDEDKDVILVDSVIRKNANMNIGDIVKVKKAVLRPAQRVVLAPTKPAEVDPEYLKKQILLGKPVIRGQIIIMPFYGDVIKFVVLRVQPEPAAYISIDTDVIVEATRAEIQHDGATYSEHRQPEVGTSPAPYVLLRVAEARSRDVGRSIVRIPVRIMKKHGVDPGDYVEIVGRMTAYATAWPAYPEDEDKDIVRMDGIIRQSAGVGIGDTVKIKKVYLKPAQRVVLVPIEPVRVDPKYLKERILLGKPVARGQAIDVPFYGGAIRFVVVEVQPGPAAYVSIDTDVIITGVERTSTSGGYSKPSAIGLPSRELSAGKELLLGTADLFRAFGFLMLFISFIYVATNYDAVGFNMPIFISTVGYTVSALISPIVSTFADRRAWASALIGILGIIPLFAIMWKVSSVDLADLFTFVILWLSISAIISMQAYLEEWGSGRFYATLAGVIGVGYMVLAIAKTIDAIRRYTRAV
jgi:antitoxin component of MazEF toxin-antitoxin module